MAQIDKSVLANLLTNGPHRSLVGGKQLTLAFAGLYIASTTLKAKPLLVWETESGYPRYYVPIESLHPDIKAQLGYDRDSNANGASGKDVKLEVTNSVEGKGNDSKALIERLTIGSRSTTWTRFVEGALMGFVRFERSEIGMTPLIRRVLASTSKTSQAFETLPVAFGSLTTLQINGSRMALCSSASRIHTNGLIPSLFQAISSSKLMAKKSLRRMPL
jgi:hypothetical protein